MNALKNFMHVHYFAQIYVDFHCVRKVQTIDLDLSQLTLFVCIININRSYVVHKVVDFCLVYYLFCKESFVLRITLFWSLTLLLYIFVLQTLPLITEYTFNLNPHVFMVNSLYNVFFHLFRRDFPRVKLPRTLC